MTFNGQRAYEKQSVVDVHSVHGGKSGRRTQWCGHWLYSAHGLLECPGHWPAAKVTQVERAVVAVFGSVTLRSS